MRSFPVNPNYWPNLNVYCLKLSVFHGKSFKILAHYSQSFRRTYGLATHAQVDWYTVVQLDWLGLHTLFWIGFLHITLKITNRMSSKSTWKHTLHPNWAYRHLNILAKLVWSISFRSLKSIIKLKSDIFCNTYYVLIIRRMV